MKDDRSPPFSDRRRRSLMAIGGAGTLLFGAQSMAQPARGVAARTPACVLTPAQTEGPYFVDERLNRADVRADPATGSVKAGALLTLNLAVTSIDGGRCLPVSGAIIDIWHCDAAGVYSDSSDAGFNTKGSKFLRGYQLSDANGRVRFTTIYPGAYPGRAVHIHFKVRTRRPGGDVEFTSQLYFDDALTDRVHAQEPYLSASERIRNARDGLYRRGGRELQLDVVGTDGGYAATYEVGLKGA